MLNVKKERYIKILKERIENTEDEIQILENNLFKLEKRVSGYSIQARINGLKHKMQMDKMLINFCTG